MADAVLELNSADFSSSSESLDEDESDEVSTEGDIFLGAPSLRVALVSDPCFLACFSGVDSLPELDESSSDSGSGVFLARDWVEESESEPESDDESELLPVEELSLPEEPVSFAVFVFAAFSLSELDEDSVEESNSLPDELVVEEWELLEMVAAVLTFFDFGASSSELESEPDEEEPLDEDTALRFNELVFAFGDAALTAGVSSSSSASLSESLDDEVSPAPAALDGT